MTRASWWLLLAAACSSKHATPTNGSAAPAASPAGSAAQPIDFADDIQHVQVFHSVTDKGVFEVHWHGAPYVPQLTCRVEAYNLVYVDSSHDAMNSPAGDHQALYRADPFVISPKTCELRFYDTDHKTLQAVGCFHDDHFERGMCDKAAWAVPKLPEGMSVDVQGASVKLSNAGGVVIRTLITVGQKLPDKNTQFSIVCDGVKSKPDPGEGFVPLSKLEAGETVYTWALAFFLEKPLSALPKQCELTITNKTTLGTFCLHEGSTDAGHCDS